MCDWENKEYEEKNVLMRGLYIVYLEMGCHASAFESRAGKITTHAHHWALSSALKSQQQWHQHNQYYTYIYILFSVFLAAAFLATVRIEPMNRSIEINKTFARTAQTNLLQNFHWHKHTYTNRFGCVVVFATLSCSYSSSLSLSGHSPCLLN